MLESALLLWLLLDVKGLRGVSTLLVLGHYVSRVVFALRVVSLALDMVFMQLVLRLLGQHLVLYHQRVALLADVTLVDPLLLLLSCVVSI